MARDGNFSILGDKPQNHSNQLHYQSVVSSCNQFPRPRAEDSEGVKATHTGKVHLIQWRVGDPNRKSGTSTILNHFRKRENPRQARENGTRGNEVDKYGDNSKTAEQTNSNRLTYQFNGRSSHHSKSRRRNILISSGNDRQAGYRFNHITSKIQEGELETKRRHIYTRRVEKRV